MTTQQMIEAIQEKIADKTLSLWCEVVYLTENFPPSHWSVINNMKKVYWLDGSKLTTENNESVVIIWHPVSLARVLNALDYKYKLIPLHNNGEYSYYIDTGAENSIKRKLTSEDWSDAMLQDQEEETIEALYNIICK